jgi:hypothetical protein
MTHKVTVGLQQKIGQPNFGSIGASCSIEVHLDDDEAVHPEVVTARVRQAFSQCRDCIAKELSLHEVVEPNESSSREREPRPAASRPTTERGRTSDRPQRTATEAQVRAIRAIASKAGVSLASELEQGFGVRNPNQLTIAQASHLIDSLKQGLTPSPA